MARNEVDTALEELEAMGDQERSMALLQTLALNLRSTADAILLILDGMGGLPGVDQGVLEGAMGKLHTFGAKHQEDDDGEG